MCELPEFIGVLVLAVVSTGTRFTRVFFIIFIFALAMFYFFVGKKTLDYKLRHIISPASHDNYRCSPTSAFYLDTQSLEACTKSILQQLIQNTGQTAAHRRTFGQTRVHEQDDITHVNTNVSRFNLWVNIINLALPFLSMFVVVV